MPNPKGNEATLTKFKPKWKSGKTQTIRVPIAIANIVLEDAKEVDINGNKPLLQVIRDLKAANEGIKDSPTDKSDLTVNEALKILKLAIKPKKQGGSYASNSAKGLKEEVLKAIALLEEIIT